MSKDNRIEYLDDERRKIWHRLTELEVLLESKTSDYEADAKESAEKAKTYTQLIEEAKDIVIHSRSEAQEKLAELKTDFTEFVELFKTIKVDSQSSNSNSDLIADLAKKIENQSEIVDEQVVEINKAFNNKSVLDDKLLKLEEIYKKGDDYDTKLSVLFKTINERKKEIDELYYGIIGYKDDDENEVKGLKAQLEEAYDLSKSRIEEAERKIQSIEMEQTNSYANFSKTKNDEFIELATKWRQEYYGVLNKIESLLPRALTTGLSAAYSEKKQAEELESKSHRTSFNIAIVGLVLISLIPFVVSIISLFREIPLEEVIMKVPRMVLAILPLYLPVLWVAYSANRKMNLAKRLIEEYSHKEVLSKTYEGLSKQIDTIDDKGISSELRIKLLYNILEVNSENPGKLISDYNKSDHPLMDALDKSIKLTNAMTKLSKIPGFSRLAVSLDKKSQKILKEEDEKANAGIDSLSVE